MQSVNVRVDSAHLIIGSVQLCFRVRLPIISTCNNLSRYQDEGSEVGWFRKSSKVLKDSVVAKALSEFRQT